MLMGQMLMWRWPPRPSKRGRSPAPRTTTLEVGLRIQNSQLPKLNQLLQSQIFEPMLLSSLNELGRNILHLGADDVADVELVSRCLQRLDVFRRDVLHPHRDEFVCRRLESKSPNVVNVFGSHILNPHGNGIVRARINSLRMQSLQIFRSLRVATVVKPGPSPCPIIRIDTNQGVYGLGEVRDGASPTYALFLKSRIVG